MFKKIYAILYVILVLSSGSVFAEDCKIDGWEESAFKPVPSKVKIFLEEETKGLFFNESSSYTDFVKAFKLSKFMEDDKANYWSNKDGHAFAEGSWNGAYVYLGNDGENYKGYNGINDLGGPVYLGNGLGQVEEAYRSTTGFPKELKIYQNLDKKYFSKDVFRAIKEKLGMPDLKSCADDNFRAGGMGGGLCGDKSYMEQTLFKHGDRYFTLTIDVFGTEDYPTGDGSLNNTVVIYKVTELNNYVQDYKKCKSLKDTGSRLKL